MARKTANAGISMPLAMLEQVDKMATQRGVTRSDFIQTIFRQWLRAEESKQPGSSKRITLDDGLSYQTAAEFWCLPRAAQVWPHILKSMNADILIKAKAGLENPTKQELLARYLELSEEDLVVVF